MDRNTEAFFSGSQLKDIPRSTFTRRFKHTTTMNAGVLVPFYCDLDILPGMTISQNTSIVARMNTPLHPTMDNAYIDTYYFKVEMPQLWDHWNAFNGENETGAWTQTIVYNIPKFKTDNTHKAGIHDAITYMGAARYNTVCQPFSKLGVRAYIRIWNYFFRSEALQAPITMYKADGDTTLDGTIITGQGLLPVNKFFDYFTSCLPQPQKHQAISQPLGTTAPVSVYGNGNALGLTSNGTNAVGLAQYLSGGVSAANMYANLANQPVGTAIGTNAPLNSNTSVGVSTNPSWSGLIGLADLSNAVAATINAQRIAWATQRIYEADATFGTRYWQETVQRFGVTTDAGRHLIPSYLGGKRTPVNIDTVLQNSESSSTAPLGETGAFSVTADQNKDFTTSFDAHCVLMGLMCIRTDHTYQQGQERQWTRTERLDFYQPEFAHIGNQPVYNYEIFTDGSSNDTGVFGYKEAWAEYKYKPNRISGMMLSDYAQSLDIWTYADDYATCPVLSDQWLRETKDNIDRTLAVQSSVADQFTVDIYVEQEVRSPMPLHCYPGLVDHF